MDPAELAAQQLRLQYRLAKIDALDRAKGDFLSFVKYVWPEAILGAHHEKMADAFNRVARGELKRLIINMPPRHTKSEFASYLLPAFIMGNKPRTKIIQATHTGELAVRFGRKVRNLMDSNEYREIYPKVILQADSKAAGRWETDKGGEYFAVGVGGAMTGRGADLLVIDDPHSEQDALSEMALDNAWEWYTSGPRQRLQPGGAIVVVMCMTGDTNVLMSNGENKQLRDIRPGDVVATYEDGRLTTAKINNWRSNGVDSIYTVRTQSGIILKANERHPFLVDFAGERKWVRLKDLKPGLRLVATKAAKGPQDRKQSLVCVQPASLGRHIIERTRELFTNRLGTMVGGKGLVAASVNVLQSLKACVNAATEGKTLPPKTLLNAVPAESSIGTGSLFKTMTAWLRNVTTYAMCVVSPLLQRTLGPIGMANFASTTVTTPGLFEGSFAMTATLRSGMVGHPISCEEPLSTYSVITDPIVEILPAGKEEVFDVEVDRTENFIANGVVSHNTRWGTKDLTARLVKQQTSHKADKWEVIEFPAILPSGKPLWPQFWALEELQSVRAALSAQKWQAQWQQQPTNDEGAILKREWWKVWQSEEPPPVEYIIQSYDTAYSKKETADYSVITTWGVFHPDQDSGPNIVLMDVKKGRWDFPELKRVAKAQYDYWKPDNVLIEAKATGVTLQQELRRVGIPVTMYSPGGRRAGTDKISRANSVAPMLEAGMVWAPDTDWAEALVEECAAFPNGDNDDMVDSTTQALMRFRAGNFVTLNTDEPDEPSGQELVMEYY
jgi:predicted phage terminase large subunit-like protein